MSTGNALSRGQIARLTGVNGETVRYYESRGLLPAPARGASGHRRYGDEHRRQLTFIRRSRELGFPLDAIAELLRLAEGGQDSCAGVRASAAAHLASIDARIADLARMRQTLAELVECCDRDLTPGCPIIDALAAEAAPPAPLRAQAAVE